MSFGSLLDLAIAEIRRRVRNGDWTERSLARSAGLSQPHVHNALKGRRTPSPAAVDRIMRASGISLAELVALEKCRTCQRRMVAQVRPRDSATSR